MIYFIEAVGVNQVKIGFTECKPLKRLAELQTGCPHKLSLAAVLPGDLADEGIHHKRWRHLHQRGEWFSIDEKLRFFITNINKREDAFANPYMWFDVIYDLWNRVHIFVSGIHAHLDALQMEQNALSGQVAYIMESCSLSPAPVRPAQASDDSSSGAPEPVITDRIRRRVLDEFRSISEMVEFCDGDRGRIDPPSN